MMHVRYLLLLYISIASLDFISGYAWSGRLERSYDSSLILEEGDPDSIDEDGIEHPEDKATLVAKSSNLHSEERQSALDRGALDISFNSVLDMENAMDQQEMYFIRWNKWIPNSVAPTRHIILIDWIAFPKIRFYSVAPPSPSPKDSIQGKQLTYISVDYPVSSFSEGVSSDSILFERLMFDSLLIKNHLVVCI